MSTIEVIAFQGDLGIGELELIERELGRIDAFGPSTAIAIDLTRVTYLDSTLLNALSRVNNRVRRKRGGRAIIIVTPYAGHAAALLELTKLDTVFDVLYRRLPGSRPAIAGAVRPVVGAVAKTASEASKKASLLSRISSFMQTELERPPHLATGP